MNTHLTEEQISQYIAGYTTGELDRHIAGCAQCSSKLASFENIIGQFRGSADNWAGKECPRILDVATLSGTFHRPRTRSLRWVAAAATLAAIVAVIPAFRKPVEPPVAELEQSRSDAQLLERVNAHLSQSAPASLQPLMEMLPPRSDLKTEGEIR
jgi:anti-sigma factor RsiW